MRPHQYINNLFIFLPLFFASRITDTTLLLNASIAFVAFSLSASSIYTLNDYHDIEEYRQHPKKKGRPLASGAISKSQAIFIMASFVIVDYTIYTTSVEVVERVHSEYIYLIALFVIMGIMRYLQIAFVLKESGFPTRFVLQDHFMQLTLLGWIITFAWILH